MLGAQVGWTGRVRDRSFTFEVKPMNHRPMTFSCDGEEHARQWMRWMFSAAQGVDPPEALASHGSAPAAAASRPAERAAAEEDWGVVVSATPYVVVAHSPGLQLELALWVGAAIAAASGHAGVAAVLILFAGLCAARCACAARCHVSVPNSAADISAVLADCRRYSRWWAGVADLQVAGWGPGELVEGSLWPQLFPGAPPLLASRRVKGSRWSEEDPNAPGVRPSFQDPESFLGDQSLRFFEFQSMDSETSSSCAWPTILPVGTVSLIQPKMDP